jgi:hypothetical protein
MKNAAKVRKETRQSAQTRVYESENWYKIRSLNYFMPFLQISSKSVEQAELDAISVDWL